MIVSLPRFIIIRMHIIKYNQSKFQMYRLNSREKGFDGVK